MMTMIKKFLVYCYNNKIKNVTMFNISDDTEPTPFEKVRKLKLAFFHL